MRAQHSRVRWLRAGVELESAAAKRLSTIDGLGLVVSHLKVGADEVHVDFAGQVQLARPVQPAEPVGCMLRHARVFSLHASVFMQSAPISLHSPHYICAAPVGPGVPFLGFHPLDALRSARSSINHLVTSPFTQP